MANVEQIKKKILEDLLVVKYESNHCGCYDHCDCYEKNQTKGYTLRNVLCYFGMKPHEIDEAIEKLYQDFQDSARKQRECDAKRFRR